MQARSAIALYPRSLQSCLYPANLAIVEFDKRRAHYRLVEAAKQNKGLLHAIVHVAEGIAVENFRRVPDARGESLRAGEILRLHGIKQRNLQIGDNGASSGQQSVCPHDQ